MKETSSERYYRLKNQGLCVRCGGLRDTDKVTCSKCSENRKKKYIDKKKSGLCVYCGNPVDNKSHAYCAVCLKEKKDLHRWQMEHKVCISCGSNPVFPGKKLCAECLLKHSVSFKKREDNMNEEQKEKEKERKRNEYIKRKEKRKEHGLCITCERKVKDGQNYCVECQLKHKRQSREYRKKHNLIKDHKFFGECKWCTNKPLLNNSFCEEHYKVVCKNLEKGRNSPKAIAAREKFKKEKIDLFWTEMKYNGKQKSN